MPSTFVILAIIVVVTLSVMLIVGVVLAVRFGQAKLKVWSARSHLKSGNLAAAVADYREAAKLMVGSKDVFKVWGGQRESFDEALEGLAIAYHQAGVAINITPLAELHQRILRMSQRAASGLMVGSIADLAPLREQARNYLSRLPHLPAGARPKTTTSPVLPNVGLAAAALPSAAVPQSVQTHPLAAGSLSEQLAPPHWRCPVWFEIGLAKDWLPRLGFCALIGMAVTLIAATPVVYFFRGNEFAAHRGFFFVLSLIAGLMAGFAVAQRIWPGRTDVECQPLCLMRKVTKFYFSIDSNTTQWQDTTWPYSGIQACGILPPGQGYWFGALVVCSDGEYDVLAIPPEFPLANLAQYLTARSVRVQPLTSLQPAWIKTWQSQVKWIAAGVSAGVGFVALLIAAVIPRSVPQPVELAGNPPANVQPADPGPAPINVAGNLPGPPPGAKSPVQAAPVGTLVLHHSWTIPEIALRGFAISPDGSRGTFFNFGSYVGIASSANGPVLPLTTKLSFPTAPVFTPNGERIYYMHLGGMSAVDPVTNAVLNEIKVQVSGAFAVSHAGKMLATLDTQALCVIAEGQPQNQRKYPLTGQNAEFLAFSADDKELLVLRQGKLLAFAVDTGAQREVWKAPDALQFTRPMITADSQWLTFTQAQQVLLVQLVNPARARSIQLPDFLLRPALARRNGRHLVFYTSTELVVWDIASNQRLAQIPQTDVAEMQLTADDKFLATRSSPKSVVNVWTLP